MIRSLSAFMALLAFGAAPNSKAQTELQLGEAEMRVAYVQSVKSPDQWNCKATPRYDTGVPMNHLLSMNFNVNDVVARFQTAANLEGKLYHSNIVMVGTLLPDNVKETAKIKLDQLTDATFDPLPDWAEWGDASKDFYELSIVPNSAPKSDKSYRLVGTKMSGFGVEDWECAVLKKNAPKLKPKAVAEPTFTPKLQSNLPPVTASYAEHQSALRRLTPLTSASDDVCNELIRRMKSTQGRNSGEWGERWWLMFEAASRSNNRACNSVPVAFNDQIKAELASIAPRYSPPVAPSASSNSNWCDETCQRQKTIRDNTPLRCYVKDGRRICNK
ncbi:MAG: hypothetical protein ACSHXY_05985 [Alphaproteobacteria bacterium]